MSMTYGGDQITFNDNSTQNTSATGFGFKNRIINGAMMIDQRNAGASVTPNNSYTVDRWKVENSQTSKLTVQQNAGSVTPPVGFTNYLGVTSSSAYSVGASDYFILEQNIEGLNLSDLAWGTANAQTITISFWVRSSLTGTFNGAINNSASNRSYTFTYSISSANTWEQKTVTIAGDTTGTWLTTNGIGAYIRWGLGVGSSFQTASGSWTAGNYFGVSGATSVVGTNGATFYITGVQLEKGSTATSFDFRSYGTELALCQRYLPAIPTNGNGSTLAMGQCYSTTAASCFVPFLVAPRTPPTGMTLASATQFSLAQASTALSNATGASFNDATIVGSQILVTGASGLVAGNATTLHFNATGGALIYFTGCEL